MLLRFSCQQTPFLSITRHFIHGKVPFSIETMLQYFEITFHFIEQIKKPEPSLPKINLSKITHELIVLFNK